MLAIVFMLITALLLLVLLRWSAAVNEVDHVTVLQRNSFSLIDRRFTVWEVASLVGVGIRTVERRMNEFRLSIGRCHCTVTDVELDSVVGNIIRSFPNTGYKKMLRTSPKVASFRLHSKPA